MLRKNATRADIYWGSYRIHIFVFLDLLQIFVPFLEILFCINNYFWYVYLSSVQVRALILGWKFRGTVFIQTISTEIEQENRTTAAATAQCKCSLIPR